MRKRGRGRPKLAEPKVRRRSIHVLVTEEERKRIKKAAAAVDMSMSAWARERILRGLG